MQTGARRRRPAGRRKGRSGRQTAMVSNGGVDGKKGPQDNGHHRMGVVCNAEGRGEMAQKVSGRNGWHERKGTLFYN